MGFVPLICRCYVFLYIRLPFSRSFWEVPKYTLFASQKNRDLGFRGMVYHIIFLFQSCRLLNTILSFQKFASITESFILYFFVSFLVSWGFIASLITSCKSSLRVPFLVLFLVSFSPFLVSSFASWVSFFVFWVSLWIFCHLFTFLVHFFCPPSS